MPARSVTNPTRVVHINTHDILGGAAKVAYRLAEAQRRAGNEAHFLVGQKRSISEWVTAFPLECDPNEQRRFREEGLLYYEYRGSDRLTDHSLVRSADLIHLHNLHGDYFNPHSLVSLGQHKPLVWTLHDMQAFTGHCAHAFDCDRWSEGCGKCPDLQTYPQIAVDATARLLADKAKTYRSVRPWLVTPSEWLRQKVAQSVMKDLPVEVIPNGVDGTLFQPQDKAEIRRALNLPVDRLLVGAVAHEGVLANPWKGGAYTLRALEALREQVPDVMFINIGARTRSELPHVVNIPHIADDRQMGRLYAALDIFLYTSVADNCPLVVLESMASGVPLVTFGTGGIPELVRDGMEGMVAPCKDLFVLVQGLRRVATDKILRDRLGQGARRRAMERFEHDRIAQQYASWYALCEEDFHRSVRGTCKSAELSREHVVVESGGQQVTRAALAAPVHLRPSLVSSSPVAAAEVPTSPPILLSVIVSTYASAAFIRECLEDLEGQTIVDRCEFIVVDAASPEQEGAIALEFQRRYGNVTYVRAPKRIGVYAAWNMAIRLARGRYITPFSTNDRLNPDAYAQMVAALETHPDVALVYGDSYVTDLPHQTFQRHHRIGTWTWPAYNYQQLLRECMIGPHPMWRRAVHETVGYFDESYAALGDQDFWIRIGATHAMMHLPVVTGLYWKSPDGLSNRPALTTPEEQRLRATYAAKRVSINQPPTAKPAPAASKAVSAAATFDCSIIIPVWNNLALTQQCVSKLAEVTDGATYEVILVDNGSTDGVQDFLRTLGGDVTVIRNEENLGFAKACNQGAQAARGEYLVFLNNDTVPVKGWLSALVEEARAHADVAVVGSKLLFEDGTIQHAGVVFPRNWGTPYHVYRKSPGDASYASNRRELQAVTAACMLVRRSVFQQVDGFDEGYQNGFEDVDLCLKIRECGMKVVYQPKSTVYHLESKTPGRKEKEIANARYYQSRWGERWWLPDEDVVHHEDGFRIEMGEDTQHPGHTFKRIYEPVEHAQWTLVAEVQRAARRRDLHAVKAGLRRVEDWPNDNRVLRWAGALCLHVDEPLRAVAFAQRSLAIKEEPIAYVTLAKHYMGEGALNEADQYLKRALALEPSHGEALLLNGILLMQRQAYADAEAAFERALAGGADQRKARLGLIMAAMGGGHAERAWTEAMRLCEQLPDDEEAAHWLLRTGTELERWDALAQRLATFIARNPASLAMRFARAGVLLRAGRRADAQRECDALRALDPKFEGLAELTRRIAEAGPVGGESRAA